MRVQERSVFDKTNLNKILDELARACGAEDAGVVLLLEDHSLVAHHHPESLRLLVHVSVVALKS